MAHVSSLTKVSSHLILQMSYFASVFMRMRIINLI